MSYLSCFWLSDRQAKDVATKTILKIKNFLSDLSSCLSWIANVRILLLRPVFAKTLVFFLLLCRLVHHPSMFAKHKMKIVARISILTMILLLITMTNGSGSFTLFMKVDGNSPIAFDLNTTSTMQDLRKEIGNVLEINGFIPSGYKISHATQDLTYHDNDTSLSDLGIGAETTIDVITLPRILYLNVTVTLGSNRPEGSNIQWDASFSSIGWFTSSWNHMFEAKVGTNTLFDDLESQVITFIEHQINHTIPSYTFGIIINPATSGPRDYTKRKHFLVSTSDGHVRLERIYTKSKQPTKAPNASVKQILFIPQSSRIVCDYYEIIGHTSLNDIYHDPMISRYTTGNVKYGFYFYKSRQDFTKYSSLYVP